MVTERKSEHELKLERLRYLSHVQLGAVYRHKKSGKHYIPKEVGMSETNLEPVVVYSPLTEAGAVWVRPFSEWQEKFEKLKHPSK
jgi:hypothetical protein